MDHHDKERKLASELGVPVNHVCIVGSTLICGTGNDTDFLCLLPSEDGLAERGFIPDVEASYESPLRSYRRDGENLIATTNSEFFFAEVAIANAAKAIAGDRFDMSSRDDRIRFHSTIRECVLQRMDGLF